MSKDGCEYDYKVLRGVEPEYYKHKDTIKASGKPRVKPRYAVTFESGKFFLVDPDDELSLSFRHHVGSLCLAAKEENFSELTRLIRSAPVGVEFSLIKKPKLTCFVWHKSGFSQTCLFSISLVQTSYEMFERILEGPATCTNKEFVVAEAGTDMNADQLVGVMAARCMYSITLPTCSVPAGYAVAIGGRVLMFPLHYTYPLREKMKGLIDNGKLKVTIKHIKTSCVYEVSITDFLNAKRYQFGVNKDVAAIEMGTDFPMSRDISGYFIDDKTLSKDLNMFIRLLKPTKDWVDLPGGYARITNANLTIGDDDSEISWDTNRFLEYAMPTQKGDCGALVSVVDPKIGPGKFLGFHIAGGEMRGIAELLSKENIRCVLDGTVVHGKLPKELVQVQSMYEERFSDEFQVVGRLWDTVGTATRSKLRKSELYGRYMTAKTAPARLRPFEDSDGNFIDPRAMAMSKYSFYVQPIRTLFLEVTIHELRSLLFNSFKIAPRVHNGVLDAEIAILGDPCRTFMEAIPRNTSPGYPFILECKGMPGKTAYFGNEPVYSLSSRKCINLITRSANLIEDAKNGIRNMHLFMDCLKDERRPIEKVVAGKTRMFCAAPLDYTIACRRYFGNFTSWFFQNGELIGSALGVNPFGVEWDHLARKLLLKGNKFICGDFSNFDGSEMPQIHYHILHLIEVFFGTENGTEDANIREVLWLDLVNSYHLSDQIVYMWDHSLPSGHPLTSVVNTLYGLILFRLAWHTLMPEDDDVESWKFDDHVQVYQFGDDSVLSVSDACSVWYNPLRLSNYFRSIGIVFTNAQKKEQVLFCSLDEVSFLKRGFRFEDEVARYIAPLELSVVLETPCWYRVGPCSDKAKTDAVDTSLSELSLHPKEVFEHWSPFIISNSCEHFKYMPSLTSRRLLLAKAVDKSKV
jgi:hypothetical protein